MWLNQQDPIFSMIKTIVCIVSYDEKDIKKLCSFFRLL